MAYLINTDDTGALEQALGGDGAAPDLAALVIPADTGGGVAGAADGLLGSEVASLQGPQGLGALALNFLVGTDGVDTLTGGDGTDLIDARGGNDRATGGGGDDLVFGGSGNDYLTGDGALAGPVSSPFPPAGDDIVAGGDGDDTLYGDGFVSYDHFGGKAGSNVLFGGAGNDNITAGYGADTVFGGSGNDFIRGYGSDVGRGSGGASARLGDFGDLLFGGAGNDTIEAGGGNDTVDGGAGDDRLTGDAGVDALTGGTGADTFVFRRDPVFASPDTGQGEGNRDVVTDFETGVDLLDLTGYGPYAVTWAYDEAANRTIVTVADPRGPLEIELSGVQALTADNILV